MKSPGRRWPWQTPQSSPFSWATSKKRWFQEFHSLMLAQYLPKQNYSRHSNTKWLPKYVWQDVIAGNHKNNQLKNGDGPGKHRLNQTTKLTSLMWGQNEIMWREAHHLYGTMAQSVLTWISSCGKKSSWNWVTVHKTTWPDLFTKVDAVKDKKVQNYMRPRLMRQSQNRTWPLIGSRLGGGKSHTKHHWGNGGNVNMGGRLDYC